MKQTSTRHLRAALMNPLTGPLCQSATAFVRVEWKCWQQAAAPPGALPHRPGLSRWRPRQGPVACVWLATRPFGLAGAVRFGCLALSPYVSRDPRANRQDDLCCHAMPLRRGWRPWTTARWHGRIGQAENEISSFLLSKRSSIVPRLIVHELQTKVHSAD